MKKGIVPIVLCIIVKDNKYLLTKRIQLDREDPKSFHNKWQIPGGAIEYGETPEKALYREVKEELGLEISIKKFIPKVFTIVRKKWHGILFAYLCQISKKDQEIILNEEASEYNYFTIKQIRKLRVLPSTLIIFNEVAKL